MLSDDKSMSFVGYRAAYGLIKTSMVHFCIVGPPRGFPVYSAKSTDIFGNAVIIICS